MIPVDAFAYETLHGVHLCESLLGEAVVSAKVLRTRYERLDRAIKSAESALADLYQIAGEVWAEEAKKAEAAE